MEVKHLSEYILVGAILTISLTQFLAIDTTDSHQYIPGSYVCRDFSRDLILNASKYHIYLDYVYVPEENHMIAGLYNPVEKTILLVEPENDEIIGAVNLSDGCYVRIPVWYDCQYCHNIVRM